MTVSASTPSTRSIFTHFNDGPPSTAPFPGANINPAAPRRDERNVADGSECLPRYRPNFANRGISLMSSGSRRWGSIRTGGGLRCCKPGGGGERPRRALQRAGPSLSLSSPHHSAAPTDADLRPLQTSAPTDLCSAPGRPLLHRTSAPPLADLCSTRPLLRQTSAPPAAGLFYTRLQFSRPPIRSHVLFLAPGCNEAAFVVPDGSGPRGSATGLVASRDRAGVHPGESVLLESLEGERRTSSRD